jgi:hypothetical protein
MAIDLCVTKPWVCVVGDQASSSYHRLDSTWASLVMNWGSLFTILYFWLFLFWPMKIIWQNRAKIQSREQQICILVFIFFWGFSIFNTGIYKYPLNILFYWVTAQIYSLKKVYSDAA